MPPEHFKGPQNTLKTQKRKDIIILCLSVCSVGSRYFHFVHSTFDTVFYYIIPGIFCLFLERKKQFANKRRRETGMILADRESIHMQYD